MSSLSSSIYSEHSSTVPAPAIRQQYEIMMRGLLTAQRDARHKELCLQNALARVRALVRTLQSSGTSESYSVILSASELADKLNQLENALSEEIAQPINPRNRSSVSHSQNHAYSQSHSQNHTQSQNHGNGNLHVNVGTAVAAGGGTNNAMYSHPLRCYEAANSSAASSPCGTPSSSFTSNDPNDDRRSMDSEQHSDRYNYYDDELDYDHADAIVAREIRLVDEINRLYAENGKLREERHARRRSTETQTNRVPLLEWILPMWDAFGCVFSMLGTFFQRLFRYRYKQDPGVMSSSSEFSNPLVGLQPGSLCCPDDDDDDDSGSGLGAGACTFNDFVPGQNQANHALV
eukprot:ANDGO_02298.mRNA.1 hypothetical protein